MKFSELPKFTKSSHYQTNIDWQYLLKTIESWQGERTAALDLNPDFQRGYVWNEKQKIAYVEYILKGGTSGRDIYFNCVGWQGSYKGPFVIVDGKQRLNAVLSYLNNEIPAFGIYLKDMEGGLKGIWERHADFIFHVNDLDTKAEVLQWYLEMNSGGTVHSEEELDKVKKLIESEK